MVTMHGAAMLGLCMNCRAVRTGRNPFRVVDIRCLNPRVARSSQPWALRRNPFGILFLLPGEVEVLEDVAAKFEELGAVSLTRARENDFDDSLNAARPRRHDDEAIAHVNGFIDIVSDEEHGRATRLPEA